MRAPIHQAARSLSGRHSRQEGSKGGVSLEGVLCLGFEEVAGGTAEQQEEAKHRHVVGEGLAREGGRKGERLRKKKESSSLDHLYVHGGGALGGTGRGGINWRMSIDATRGDTQPRQITSNDDACADNLGTVSTKQTNVLRLSMLSPLPLHLCHSLCPHQTYYCYYCYSFPSPAHPPRWQQPTWPGVSPSLPPAAAAAP